MLPGRFGSRRSNLGGVLLGSFLSIRRFLLKLNDNDNNAVIEGSIKSGVSTEGFIVAIFKS